MWRVGILTVSDTRTAKTDASGKILAFKFAEEGYQVSRTGIVSDEISEIQRILLDWSDEEKLDLIITTGGTGFSARDVTPEATKPLLQKEASGLISTLLEACRAQHPMGCLSRLLAGIRGSTLLINFPGSQHAVQTCFSRLAQDGVLRHALQVLSGKPTSTGYHHHHHHHEPKSPTPKIDLNSAVDRPRESEYKMYQVHDAVSKVLETIAEHHSFRNESISERFIGRILNEDVFAEEPYPNCPVSIKDGYAVISSDEETTRLVASSVEAGNVVESPLTEGHVARITTGAPLPPGADAVVQVEDTVIEEKTEDGKEEKSIRITTPLDAIKPGQDVRETGSDISKGSLLLPNGSVIGAAELGVLTTAGVNEIKVLVDPKVSVLSTGNELVDPLVDNPPPGFVRDSNRVYLKSLFRSKGFEVYDAGVARDNVGDIIKKIQNSLTNSDVLVSTGGVSMGEKDLVKEVLIQHFKAEIVFGRVFMKPGKPMTFGVIKEGFSSPKFVFALPGNPVSAFVTTEIFVMAALRRMRNEMPPFPPIVKIGISDEIALDPRPEFRRVIVTLLEDGQYALSFTGNQISSRLLSCVGVNGLMRLPPKTEEQPSLPANFKVDVLLIGPVKSDPHSQSLLRELS